MDADTERKLRILTAHLYEKQKLALELYERGGSHAKDLEVARTYTYVHSLFLTLFPELTTELS